MLESVFGVYAKKGLLTRALIFGYTEQPDRSMLMAGIWIVISGIFVVFSDKGRIPLSKRVSAPSGEMK